LYGTPALLVAVILIHYTGVVLGARAATPGIFVEALAPDKPLVPLTRLTEERLQWLLAVEDPRFFEHGGIDLTSAGAGLTTITQSIVKQLYFEKFKPGLGKIRQTLIAYFAVDPMVPKNDQLLYFLSAAYFGSHAGRPVKGFGAAAQTYFGAELEALTDDQYLALVAMLVSPNRLHVERYPDANQERVRRIKRLLAGECEPAGLSDVYYDTCK
jgi:membrane peptidoglycan carboxypeptidase